MGLMDAAKKLARKHQNKPKNTRDETKPSSRTFKGEPKGESLVLSHVDGKVAFFEDIVEVRDLMGNIVRDISYDEIEHINMNKHDSVEKDMLVAFTHGMDKAATKSTLLIMRTAIDEYKFDFRDESEDRIKQALRFVKIKIHPEEI